MRSNHPPVKRGKSSGGSWAPDSFFQTGLSILKGSKGGSRGECWEAEKGQKDCREACRGKRGKNPKLKHPVLSKSQEKPGEQQAGRAEGRELGSERTDGL